MPMSSNSNDIFSPYKSKVEGEIVSSKPISASVSLMWDTQRDIYFTLVLLSLESIVFLLVN